MTRTAQLTDALSESLTRLAAITYDGCWQAASGPIAQFTDRGGTGTSFLLQPGETIGDALARIDARYREAR